MATKSTKTNGSKKTNGKSAAKAANPNSDPAMKAGSKNGGKKAALKLTEAQEKATITLRDTSKDSSKAPAKAKPGPDPRMPKVGTVIQKLDRRGSVRCECEVMEGGMILYDGKLYKSLSAAAVTAAKKLKLGGKTQNGFTFWGLSKPPRKPADALEAMARAWERYVKIVNGMTGSITAENWEEVHAAIKDHATQIAEMNARADKEAEMYKKAA